MLKYLRIAVTALSLTACVLLVIFWVRSVYTLDHFFHLSNDKYLEVWSCQNKILIDGGKIEPFVPMGDAASRELHNAMTALAKARSNLIKENGSCPIPETNWVGFGWSDRGALVVPYWFPVGLTASTAAVPWIRWSRRFGLRALLLAVTVAAVVLGIIVAF